MVAPDPGSRTRDIRECVAAARIFVSGRGGAGDMTEARIGPRLGPCQIRVFRLIARAPGYLRPRLLDQQDRSVIAAA